jgi:DNA-binding MarR family transcriptional regulator
MDSVKDATETNGEAFWPTLVEFLFATRSWWVAVCAEFDLTPAQGHALRVLDPGRPVPMSMLAEALVCDASNVTGIVDKLESRGLIARQGSDLDRRVKQLAVTERGRRIRDKLVAAVMNPPPAVAALPGDVKTRLTGVLRALLTDGGLTR